MVKLLVGVAGLALAASAQAQIWTEVGDAGDLPGTAQVTNGVGALLGISGSYLANDVDLYAIKIVDPANFGATVTSGGDSQLWLFSMAGAGIAHNDDSPAGGLLSRLLGSDLFTSGTTTGLTLASQLVAGDCYLLGVSRYNRDARDGAALAMFANSPFNGIHGVVAGAGLLASWTGTTVTGPYTIDLRGTEYCIPAPGAMALLGLSGLVAGRRRR